MHQTQRNRGRPAAALSQFNVQLQIWTYTGEGVVSIPTSRQEPPPKRLRNRKRASLFIVNSTVHKVTAITLLASHDFVLLSSSSSQEVYYSGVRRKMAGKQEDHWSSQVSDVWTAG